MLINKQLLENYMLPSAKKDFKYLIDIGIGHFCGKSLSEKLIRTSNKIDFW